MVDDACGMEMLERQRMLNAIRQALLYRVHDDADCYAAEGGAADREERAERARRLSENFRYVLEEAQVALDEAAPKVCAPGDAGRAARRRIGRIDEMFYELRAMFDGLAADGGI